MGFSINLLTLFAMVLSIGIVVDDAIVVVENVERNMEQNGLAPREATLRAMDEVTGPVVATTLVLMAVFIPVAFLGGITGQLYMQFALTIAISVGISAIAALTLTPALCALLLKPRRGDPNRFFAWFNRHFGAVTERYGNVVGGSLRRVALMLVIYAVMIAATVALFRGVPSSFVPAEDQGAFLTAVMLPDAASLERTEAVTDRVGELILQQGAADRVVTVAGFSILDSGLKSNAAAVFVGMKPFAERAGVEEQQIGPTFAALGRAFSGIREAFTLPINPPAIPGLGSVGGFEFWIQSLGEGTTQQLDDVAQKFLQAAAQRPELAGLNTTFKASNMQLRLDVDREKAETLGVPIEQVYDSLQTLFGSVYASQFNLYSRVWWVILQAEPAYRNKPDDLRQIYVRSAAGHMIPLSTLVSTRYLPGPDIVPRFNGFPAAKITGNPAAGYSSGQALAAMEQVAAEALPDHYGFAWSGQAYEEKRSGGSSLLAFGFGILMAFLILAALYEHWSLPFAVILAVPFGLFGAIVAVWLRGTENDVYFQIGLVTLIGLSAKNAILIVEFAAERVAAGMSLTDAAVAAARLRLRPIIMTSLCFILGVVPLVIASGAGANSRHSIGTGVMGGMLAATFLAIFLVPLFFTLLQRHRAKPKHEVDSP
jgi:multidrug efflux pump